MNLPVQVGHPALKSDEVEKRLCEKSLYEFMRHGWHVLEPGNPFQDAMHLKALCEHLEAVTDGRIKRLIANVCPGFCKSMCCGVFWPAWEWIKKPETRWLFVSYSDDFAMRDSSKTRMLIKSAWYQGHWRDNYFVRYNADTKSKFENNKAGFRQSTSIQGGGTGSRADRIVCFPPNEIVLTDMGKVSFKDGFDSKLEAKAMSIDVKTGEFSYKRILKWHKNPGREIVEIVLNDGSRLRCTADHNILTRRGWVRAGDLRCDTVPSFPVLDEVDVVFANAEPFANLGITAGGNEDFGNIFGVNNNSVRGFCSSNSLLGIFVGDAGRLPPESSVPYGINCSSRQIESLGQNSRLLVARDNFSGYIGSDFCTWPSLQYGKSPMPLRIRNILRSSSVTQVFQGIILWIAVKMANFAVIWPFSDERFGNKLMNEPNGHDAVFAETKTKMSARLIDWFKNTFFNSVGLAVFLNRSPGFASDSAKRADAIKTFKADYRSPLFVRHVGYSEETYCLTVEDNHTAVVGSVNGIVAQNCDDLLKIEEAYSQTERDRVNKWYDEVGSMRGSDPRTSSEVIVHQRLHVDDITGHLTRRGGYVHFFVPLEFDPSHVCETPLWKDPRTVPGDCCWPLRFTPEIVAEKKKTLGFYGANAQLQQRPETLEGGIIRKLWFCKFVPHLPKQARRVRAWDLASTAQERSKGKVCFTASVLMSRDVHGCFYIEEVLRGKWDPHERDKVMLSTAYLDRQKYGAVTTVVEREGGSSGKDQEQAITKLLYGFEVWFEHPTGPKDTRIMAFASQLGAGNVYFPEDAPWLPDYVQELVSVPHGDYWDQVDATSAGFNNLSKSSWFAPAIGDIPGSGGRIDDLGNQRPDSAGWWNGGGLRNMPGMQGGGLRDMPGGLR